MGGSFGISSWSWGALLALGLIALTIGIPFKLDSLRGDVERAATSALGREVTLAGPVEARLSFRPSLEINELLIAAEPGTGAEHAVAVGTARLGIRLLPLLGREIHLSEISAERVLVDLEMGALGSDGDRPTTNTDEVEGSSTPVTAEEATWTFAGIDRLSMKHIDLTLRGRDGAEHRFELDELSGRGAPGRRMQLEAAGSLLEQPFDLDFSAPSIRDFQAGNELQFELEFRVSRLDGFNELLDVGLPAWGPFTIAGDLTIRSGLFDLSSLEIGVGGSKLTGSLEIDATQERPRLALALEAPLIQLDDFREVARESDDPETLEEDAEQEPLAEEPAARTRPSPFDADVLRRLDATVELTVGSVRSGDDEFGAGVVELRLEDGRLELEPVTIAIPGGEFDGALAYAPSEADVALDLRLTIEEFDYGVLTRRAKPGTEVGGVVSMAVELSSRAPDQSTLMQHASGYVDFAATPEGMPAGILDLWATNLISSMLTILEEKEETEINCMVVRLDLEDGLMTEKVVYLDATNMRMNGKADLDFHAGTFRIVVAPRPKKPELLAIPLPLKFEGTFEDFGFGIAKGGLVGAILTAAASPVTVPVDRLFGEDEAADGVEACRVAWERSADRAAERR